MSWNPFSHLVRSRKYQYGHIITSSFLQRIFDTLRVFYGEFTLPDFAITFYTAGRRPSLGILDYIFPIQRILFILVTSFCCYPEGSNIAFIGFYILIIPLIVSTLVKGLSACLLTLLVLPFVSLVHLLSQLRVNHENEKIRNLIVSEVENIQKTNIDLIFSEEKRLGDFCSNRFKVKAVSIYNFPDSTLYDEQGSFQEKYEVIFGLFNIDHNSKYYNKMTGVIRITPQNLAGIHAMLKTNTFHATETLEDQSIRSTGDINYLFNRMEKQVKNHIEQNKTFVDGMCPSVRNESSVKKFVEAPLFDRNLVHTIFHFSGHDKNRKVTYISCKFSKNQRVS